MYSLSMFLQQDAMDLSESVHLPTTKPYCFFRNLLFFERVRGKGRRSASPRLIAVHFLKRSRLFKLHFDNRNYRIRSRRRHTLLYKTCVARKSMKAFGDFALSIFVSLIIF